MPFDYDAYQKKCNVMTADQLQKEWENYTRQISAGATGTATSVLLMPYTAGISLVGLGVSAPRIHNARKKREIIEAGLQARGASPVTRKRDVLAAVGVSGAVSGLTMGIVPPGADVGIGTAVQHGFEYVAAHAALGGSGAVVVHEHDEYCRRKGEEEARRQNSVDHLNLEGRLAESNVYNPTLHTSHTWPLDNASIADTVKSGPVSTPFADDASVLFPMPPNQPVYNPSLSKPQLAKVDVASGDIKTVVPTEAQQEMLRRMELLQIEIEKRGAGFQIPADGSAQPTPPEGSQDHSFVIFAQDDIPGLGITGLNHDSSSRLSISQLSDPSTQADQIHPRSSSQFNRPQLSPRTESLPAKLSLSRDLTTGDQSYNYGGEYRDEPLPSYQQHCIAPSPNIETSSHEYQYPIPMIPDLPERSQTQDSGYYSLTSTPSINGSTLQATNYPATQNFLSTQVSSPQPYTSPSGLARKPVPASTDSGLHRHSHVHRPHRASEPSPLSTSAAMPPTSSSVPSLPPLPPPPPYSQPQSNTITTTEREVKEPKDYFSNQTSSAVASTPRPSLAKKKSEAILKGVNQGWQWAKSFPLPGDTKTRGNVEPDYGPPPEIPVAWRGM